MYRYCYFTGATGPMGDSGAMGTMGHMGPSGAMGPMGPTGMMGPSGAMGSMGPMGLIGPVGSVGPIGLIGPPGPTGSISQTFINAYSVTEQLIPNGGSVIFDTHNSIFGDCAHLPNSAEIFIWKYGFYFISASIHHLEACQFSMYKNQINIIPGSTIGSISGSAQTTSNFIIEINENDMITQTDLSPFGFACKLQMINNTNLSNLVTLYGSPSSGNSIPQITATINILLLK
jgi:hypothetical protein